MRELTEVIGVDRRNARREPSGAAFTVAALSKRSAGMTRQTRGSRVHERWAVGGAAGVTSVTRGDRTLPHDQANNHPGEHSHNHIAREYK
jgi:hypothetical protein